MSDIFDESYGTSPDCPKCGIYTSDRVFMIAAKPGWFKCNRCGFRFSETFADLIAIADDFEDEDEKEKS